MAARQLYGLVQELLNCQWSFPIIPYHQCSNPLGHWLDGFGYSSSVLSPLQYFIDIVTCEMLQRYSWKGHKQTHYKRL